MSKPTILTVDDDPTVSAGIARDLGSRYGADYRLYRVIDDLLGDGRQANPDDTYDLRVVERDTEAQRLKLTGSALTQRDVGEAMSVHLMHGYRTTI